jgi:hypothetical protein
MMRKNRVRQKDRRGETEGAVKDRAKAERQRET